MLERVEKKKDNYEKISLLLHIVLFISAKCTICPWFPLTHRQQFHDEEEQVALQEEINIVHQVLVH